MIKQRNKICRLHNAFISVELASAIPQPMRVSYSKGCIVLTVHQSDAVGITRHLRFMTLTVPEFAKNKPSQGGNDGDRLPYKRCDAVKHGEFGGIGVVEISLGEWVEKAGVLRQPLLEVLE